MVVFVLSCAVAILSILVAALVVQLRARDPEAARRNPSILRSLSPRDVQLITAGVNDVRRGQGSGVWPVGQMTTRAQRVQCKILFGLGATLTECAEGLGVTLVRDPEASGRRAVHLFRDLDELRYRPGLERTALVVLCGEALRRSEVEFTHQDAESLADELTERSPASRNKML